ncbi:ribonuclease domain-containing protein [Arenimonas daejeonensis]|uniref:ribonuclease domain-containing protein n=1 Tax=Arenimonas daejeonensis TaxID=370777 RepID=UPI0011BF4099|nr:ribonuclease domain-containing protein [Arenimonas daejeonensis]
MQKFRPVLVLLVVLVLAWSWLGGVPAPESAPAQDAGVVSQAPAPRSALPDFLPPEASDTLVLIARGGPFPHRQDGSVFQNRERRLPQRARGHYREYTVRTPGLGHRGPRRIVTGGDPPAEYWYTDDHYQSFRRFEVPR